MHSFGLYLPPNFGLDPGIFKWLGHRSLACLWNIHGAFRPPPPCGRKGIVQGAPLGNSTALPAREPGRLQGSRRAVSPSCLSLGMWACLFLAVTWARLVSSVGFPRLCLHGHFSSFCSLPPQCPCSIIFINWLTALIDPTNLYLTRVSVFK